MGPSRIARLSPLLLGLTGCGAAGAVPSPDAGAAADVATAEVPSTDAGGGGQCAASAVRCADQQVMQMRLFDSPSPATITEEGTTAGEFRSLVDARAGGSMVTQGFVYARFTEAGLEKVELSDQAAFRSMDWDIAVRRYVVRINSGVSGPSCVTAARAPGTDFAALSAAPAAVEYRTEAYFTETCEIVNDGSSIAAPGTALASFWAYRSCVEMTGNVFALRLRDGRAVKLQVTSYYDPAAQEACNTTGMAPTPNGAGNVRLRWAFLGR
ncbi:MAG: HmuY family protein [Deltaproteobacteria bacterium]|nr:HmuY family protein [Myxococcales bacterium]MDP3217546.1 HmuY family protein [Deltaproteobacteria bacterium]